MGSAPGLELVCPRALDKHPGGWVLPPLPGAVVPSGEERGVGSTPGDRNWEGARAAGGDRQRVQGCGQSRAWALNLWAETPLCQSKWRTGPGRRRGGPPWRRLWEEGWPWAKAGSTFVTSQCLSARSHPVPRWQGCKPSPGCQAGGTHQSALPPPPLPQLLAPFHAAAPRDQPGEGGVCAVGPAGED